MGGWLMYENNGLWVLSHFHHIVEHEAGCYSLKNVAFSKSVNKSELRAAESISDKWAACISPTMLAVPPAMSAAKALFSMVMMLVAHRKESYLRNG